VTMAKKITKPVLKPPPTSIRFEPHVKSALEKAAKEDSRSVTSLVTKLVVDFLKAEGYLK
jgi:hypothetical protein